MSVETVRLSDAEVALADLMAAVLVEIGKASPDANTALANVLREQNNAYAFDGGAGAIAVIQRVMKRARPAGGALASLATE